MSKEEFMENGKACSKEVNWYVNLTPLEQAELNAELRSNALDFPCSKQEVERFYKVKHS